MTARRSYFPTDYVDDGRDIIHPTNQTSADSEFYTKWAEREKPAKTGTARPPSQFGVRARKDGSCIDEALMRRFKQLWEADVPKKTIQRELGLGTNTQQRLVQHLGLKPRYRNSGNVPPEGNVEHHMSLYMPKELRQAMDKRIFGRYRSPSAYIRALIRRDIGL